MQSLWRTDFPRGTNPAHFFLFASKPHRRPALIAFVAVIAAGVVSGSVSYIFKLIADAAVKLSEGGSSDELLWACGIYILALAAAKLLWRLSGFAGARWATGARATARHALTAYVTLHSRAYFSSRFAGSIANKISHAASGMVDLIELILWDFMDLFVSAIMSFIIAFYVSPTIAWIFLGWIAVVAAVNIFFGTKRIPLSAKAHELETGLTGLTVDLLSNISAMQEYARRAFEMRRLEKAIVRRRMAGMHNWFYGERVLVLNNILQMLFGGAMVFVAVQLMQAGEISIGDIMLVVAIVFRIEGLLQVLGANFNRISETWGEVEESLNEIIEPHEIVDAPEAKELAITKGEITFKQMSFSYESGDVFKALTLTIQGGQRVGLVGKSGSGKSTLVRLMLHHHDVHSGSIMIDGQNIAQVTQESLRAAIGVVPQEPLLFHRTIAENIEYGRPGATKQEIEKAAKLAHAHEFIKRLPDGYDSLVGERGVKLSGGERQRIAIARAILKNAPILLLDEATSALDSESEVAIQEALRTLMKGKTVIAIAHRLSTLREMDRILVLDKGRIVEDGTHDELMEEEGVYSELWTHQAGGFLQDEE